MAQETYADISKILSEYFIEQEEFIVEWLNHLKHFITPHRTETMNEGCQNIVFKLNVTKLKLMYVVNSHVGKLEDRMDRRDKKVDELEKLMQQLHNENIKIRQERDAMVDEQKYLKARFNLANEVARSQKNQKSEYKSQINELQKQVNKKNNEVDKLNESLEQLEEKTLKARQTVPQLRLRIDHLEKELMHAQANQQSVYAELQRMLAVIQASMPHGDKLSEMRHVPSRENLGESLDQSQEIHFKRMSDDSMKMYVQSPMPYKSEESTHAMIMQMLAILWPNCRKMSTTLKTMIEGKEKELEELCTANSAMHKKFDELVKEVRQWPLRILYQEKHIPNKSWASESTGDKELASEVKQ